MLSEIDSKSLLTCSNYCSKPARDCSKSSAAFEITKILALASKRAAYYLKIRVSCVEFVPRTLGKVEFTKVEAVFDYKGVRYCKVNSPPIPFGIL